MTPKQEAALRLAREALQYVYEGANNQGPHTGISWRCASNKIEPVIAAIDEALADSALDRMAENARELGLDYEPPCKTGSQCTNKCQQCEQPAQQHEPVAWFELLREARDNCKASIVEEGISASRKEYRIDLEARLTAALNTSPPASKPVAWRTKNATPPGGYVLFQQYPQAVAELGGEIEPLFTSPQPSKPWVGLTEEEIKDCFKITPDQHLPWHIYQRIEAKLKERNT